MSYIWTTRIEAELRNNIDAVCEAFLAEPDEITFQPMEIGDTDWRTARVRVLVNGELGAVARMTGGHADSRMLLDMDAI